MVAGNGIAPRRLAHTGPAAVGNPPARSTALRRSHRQVVTDMAPQGAPVPRPIPLSRDAVLRDSVPPSIEIPAAANRLASHHGAKYHCARCSDRLPTPGVFPLPSVAVPETAHIPQLHALLEPLLAETHRGDPWYGPSRAAALEGVTAADAAARPIATAHSIWELVLHMTAWTNEVRARLAGAQAGMPKEGDWPSGAATDETAWSDARAALDRANAELVLALRALSENTLSQRVNDTRDAALGTGVTMAAMLAGLAQHDAYHTGQILLLRRALDARG